MTGSASTVPPRRRLAASAIVAVLLIPAHAGAAPPKPPAAPEGRTEAQTAAEWGEAALQSEDFSTALTEYILKSGGSGPVW